MGTQETSLAGFQETREDGSVIGPATALKPGGWWGMVVTVLSKYSSDRGR